jgi:hypothetical protein
MTLSLRGRKEDCPMMKYLAVGFAALWLAADLVFAAPAVVAAVAHQHHHEHVHEEKRDD